MIIMALAEIDQIIRDRRHLRKLKHTDKLAVVIQDSKPTRCKTNNFQRDRNEKQVIFFCPECGYRVRVIDEE